MPFWKPPTFPFLFLFPASRSSFCSLTFPAIPSLSHFALHLGLAAWAHGHDRESPSSDCRPVTALPSH
ncbi:hypothetical protein BRADI_2g11195v3 [Brachypodium distachyon]|uniref:Uncharacterized protein n=1 Tax=Brachypodium distachyon TaxID=15368 RepID=A0A2K2D7X5_BRADI|nr:hypothetical protein BRADI_2g11195v3 [Brachypodium distachyon]